MNLELLMLLLFIFYLICALLVLIADKKSRESLKKLESKQWGGIKITITEHAASSRSDVNKQPFAVTRSQIDPDDPPAVNDLGVSGIFQSVVDHVPSPFYESDIHVTT